jgi:hypothetical protein
MHDGRIDGYGPGMTHSGPPLSTTHPVVSGDDVAGLLGRQHAELRTLLTRVPTLHDAAREDVFLRVRRLLAIHLELETVLLLPRLDGVPDDFRPDEEIVAAEHEELESTDFDAAMARVADALLRHVGVLGEVRLSGQLSPREGEAVAAAIRLWDGQGDAYLGNTWSEMVAAVSHELVSEAGSGSR